MTEYARLGAHLRQQIARRLRLVWPALRRQRFRLVWSLGAARGSHSKQRAGTLQQAGMIKYSTRGIQIANVSSSGTRAPTG